MAPIFSLFRVAESTWALQKHHPFRAVEG